MIAMDRLDTGAAERKVMLPAVENVDDIQTIELLVVAAETDLEEVRSQGNTLGYIRHVGAVFVALVGERRDRAEECGQFLLWNHAAGQLLSRRRTGLHLSAA